MTAERCPVVFRQLLVDGGGGGVLFRRAARLGILDVDMCETAKAAVGPAHWTAVFLRVGTDQSAASLLSYAAEGGEGMSITRWLLEER